MMNIPLVDAHLHVWDLDRFSYPWLSTVPSINQTYLLPDYDMARGDHEVEAMVFVQCECEPRQFLDELEWVKGIADVDSRLQGIVPWAPLEKGEEVGPILEKMSEDPRVKGIRRILQGETIDFCIQPGFIRGVQLLSEYDLHFELCIDPSQFPYVIRLIEKCPDTNFILDHVGNPDIANKQLEPWKRYLKTLKDSGDHFCKFSNLVCNADIRNWTLDDLTPYADSVVDTFTPERLIWASDWPHALRASTFTRWVDTADELTNDLTKDERMLIFHDNAVNFYRL